MAAGASAVPALQTGQTLVAHRLYDELSLLGALARDRGGQEPQRHQHAGCRRRRQGHRWTLSHRSISAGAKYSRTTSM